VEGLAAGNAGAVGRLALVALAVATAKWLPAGHALAVSGAARVTDHVAASTERAPALDALLLGRSVGHVGLLRPGPAMPREVGASPGPRFSGSYGPATTVTR